MNTTLLPLTLLAALVTVSSSAQTDVAEPAEPQNPTITFGAGRVQLFPAGDVYAVHIADPHRATNAVDVQFHMHVGVPDSSDVRSWLAGGGRFGILRVAPRTPHGRSWQFSIEAGLDAQFDSYHRLDNLGYDGLYGLVVTTATDGPLALKVAVLHTSAHLGDEYARRVGRERIGYTRQEVASSAALRFGRGFRVYGEAAYAFDMLNEELQRPGRVQGGMERVWPHGLAGGRFQWYAALDLQSWQERAWRVDYTLEAGIRTVSAGRTWRAGLRYGKGRVPLGEFFQYTESWITVGLWMDL